MFVIRCCFINKLMKVRSTHFRIQHAVAQCSASLRPVVTFSISSLCAHAQPQSHASAFCYDHSQLTACVLTLKSQQSRIVVSALTEINLHTTRSLRQFVINCLAKLRIFLHAVSLVLHSTCAERSEEAFRNCVGEPCHGLPWQRKKHAWNCMYSCGWTSHANVCIINSPYANLCKGLCMHSRSRSMQYAPNGMTSSC